MEKRKHRTKNVHKRKKYYRYTPHGKGRYQSTGVIKLQIKTRMNFTYKQWRSLEMFKRKTYITELFDPTRNINQESPSVMPKIFFLVCQPFFEYLQSFWKSIHCL